ncbi:MAG: methyltransferase [Pirellulaceae bacterium]
MRDLLQSLLFSFYYPYCSLMNRLLPRITLDGVALRILPGIYKPLDEEHRLIDFIESGKAVLDVGCGSGVLTVFAAMKSAHVTAVDISPQAIKNTQLNCRNLGIENVSILLSNMYDAVDQKFDYIVSYPPLFQVAFKNHDKQWCTSKTFLEELFKGAESRLNPGGKLVVLLPVALGKASHVLWQRFGLELESVVAHSDRSFAVRLHSLPYLHFNMDNHIYTIRPSQSEALQTELSGPATSQAV